MITGFIVLVMLTLMESSSMESNIQKTVKKLKQRIQAFNDDSKCTLKELESMSAEAKQPVCGKTNFSRLKTMKMIKNRYLRKSIVIGQLINSIEFLSALYDFTYKRNIMSPRLQQRLRRERHDLIHISAIYGVVRGIRSAKYKLKEQPCNESGSFVMDKLVIQVYADFRMLFRKLRIA